MDSSFGWRGGFGLWLILLPAAAAPLLVTLVIGQRRARKAGLLTRSPIFARGLRSALWTLAVEIDAVGLALFSSSLALILVPLTLAGHGTRSSDQFIYIFSGVCLLAAFAWQQGHASLPIMPVRILRNPAVVCICLCGILDFFSFYLSFCFLSAFVQVLKDWDQARTAYFTTTQNVTSTLIGIGVGYLMARTRRYKALLVCGFIVRLVGVSLMVRYRSEISTTSLLVMCQLLQGIGGGSIAITMQVAVQTAVRHSDIAVVTALELLTTEIGAAAGSAVAGLIFSRDLPVALAHFLPGMPAEERQRIYGSLSVALSYALGSAEREGIIEAWVSVMRTLCIIASLALVPGVFLALSVPDHHLPDAHGGGPGAATASSAAAGRRRAAANAPQRSPRMLPRPLTIAEPEHARHLKVPPPQTTSMGLVSPSNSLRRERTSLDERPAGTSTSRTGSGRRTGAEQEPLLADSDSDDAS